MSQLKPRDISEKIKNVFNAEDSVFHKDLSDEYNRVPAESLSDRRIDLYRRGVKKFDLYIKQDVVRYIEITRTNKQMTEMTNHVGSTYKIERTLSKQEAQKLINELAEWIDEES